MSPAASALALEAERLATRLRVLGPRWAARGAPDPAAPRVRQALAVLADVARRAEGLPPAGLPPFADHALADVLLVLAADADRALAAHAPERVEQVQVLQELRRSL